MKRVIVLALGLALSFIAIVHLVMMHRAKQLYEELVREAASAIPVASFDSRSQAFIAELDNHWAAADDDADGYLSLGLEAAGLMPSVRNVTNVCLSPTARFSWWRPRQNVRSAVLAQVKSGLLETAPDAIIQVSEDGHLALLWLGPDTVILLEDEPNGMREVRYHRKEQPSDPGFGPAGRLAVVDDAPVAGLADPGAESEVVRHEIARLQGVWSLVYASRGGQPVSDRERRATRWIFEGDEVTTTLEGRPYFREKIFVNPLKRPKTIDFEMTVGAGEAIRKLAIYEWEGDRLKLCIAQPGAARPAEFSALEGSLSVWRRVPTVAPAENSK